MMRFILLGVCLTALFVARATAQSPAVVGVGYTDPSLALVAPGQIITVFATGAGASLTGRLTAGSPLPTTLGGLSASVAQGPLTVPLPIFSVFPVRMCLNENSATCARLVGLTVQLPFEMAVQEPGSTNATQIMARLIVSDQAGNTTAMDLTPWPDRTHVVGSVTHANGDLVSAGSPAIPGEVLVAYAVGLGVTTPRVATGSVSPSPAATAHAPFVINFDYTPNAAPSPGVASPTSGIDGPSSAPVFLPPLFVGLSPGAVGLYQFNFRVLGPPAGTSACGDRVLSNLTVTFVGPNSFDGAAICVRP